LKSPLKVQATKATCHSCAAGEALHMAMLMAMPWTYRPGFLNGTIRFAANVCQQQVANERRDLARAELLHQVPLDIVQRDLQRFGALQVRLRGGAHVFLLLMRRFRTSGVLQSLKGNFP
jgi:hypothetical protein